MTTTPDTPAVDTESDAVALLAGAGGYRRPIAEWVIYARLHLASETHIGGTSDPTDTDAAIDQLLDRDRASGQPRLRFSTLVGLLRHYLTDYLAGYADPTDPGTWAEPAAVADLFGSTDAASAVSGPDIVLHSPTAPMVRAHNRVDAATGAVAPGAFWSTETLPAGTNGRVQIRIRIDATDKILGPDEARLLALLSRATAGLNADEPDAIRVGARTRTGQGRLRATDWHATRHDLQTIDGWSKVYGPGWDEHAVVGLPQTGDVDLNRAVEAALGGHPELAQKFTGEVAQLHDRRRVDTLTLTLAVGEPDTLDDTESAPIRVGTIRTGDFPAPDQPEEADLAHRTTPITTDAGTTWEPVLGAGSLLAVLKTAARRHERLLADDTPAARAWHARWWGGEPGDEGTPTPARITATETLLTGAVPLRRGRNSIDALFGDAADAHLFTESVYVGGHGTIRLLIPDADDAIRGQLLQLVADLASWSPWPVGGGGHGTLTATSAIWSTIQPDAEDVSVDWLELLRDPSSDNNADWATRAAEWMRAFREALTSEPSAGKDTA